MGEILLTTATEEKAILHKVGAKFDTEAKKKQLYALRLQKFVANKILFSNLWKYPDILIEMVKHTGLADEETAKFYIEQIQG